MTKLALKRHAQQLPLESYVLSVPLDHGRLKSEFKNSLLTKRGVSVNGMLFSNKKEQLTNISNTSWMSLKIC